MFKLQNVTELNESNDKIHGYKPLQIRSKSRRIQFVTITLSGHVFVGVAEEAAMVALMPVVLDTTRIPGPLLAWLIDPHNDDPQGRL